MKKAIVTGCPGQDASYLSNFLLEKDYKVIGTHRYSSTEQNKRFEGFPLDNKNFDLEYCDIVESGRVYELVNEYKPDEIYNLAAASHVGYSFSHPQTVLLTNALGPLNWLEGIKQFSPTTKFMQASTSELWGNSVNKDGFQDEETPFKPTSPYSCAKLFAHNMVDTYRKAYNIFACAAITHNHESERRGEQFVTRKITKWCAKLHQQIFGAYLMPNVEKYIKEHTKFDDEYIYYGQLAVKIPKLKLGNIYSSRDWSHSQDMVEGFWKILQYETSEDFVLSSGEVHSVEDFLKECFSLLKIKNWQDYIMIDKSLYRPSEVNYLRGDSTKARLKLKWESKISFKELVRLMLENDIKLVEKENV